MIMYSVFCFAAFVCIYTLRVFSTGLKWFFIQKVTPHATFLKNQIVQKDRQGKASLSPTLDFCPLTWEAAWPDSRIILCIYKCRLVFFLKG